MNRLRAWLAEHLLRQTSGWFLHVYRRPLVFLIGLVAVPLAVVVSATYSASVSAWRAHVLHNLGVTAKLGAEIIDETFDESFGFAQMLAAQPGFTEELRRGDRTHLTSRLEQALPFAKRIDLALILSPTGTVIAGFPEQPGLVGRDIGQEESLRSAQEGGWHASISAVYLRDGPEIEKVVGLVLPITDANGVAGVLQVQHRVETIKSWVQKLRIDPEGFLYVVDHHSQLVVYPFQVLPGRPKIVSNWPPVAALLSDQGTVLTFHDRRSNQQWLAAAYPIADTGWRVVAVQPERAALSMLHGIFRTLGLLVLLLFSIVVSVSLRWVELHNLSLRLLRQNGKLLRQIQQRRSTDQMRGPDRFKKRLDE